MNALSFDGRALRRLPAAGRLAPRVSPGTPRQASPAALTFAMSALAALVATIAAHALAGCGGQPRKLGAQPDWRGPEASSDAVTVEVAPAAAPAHVATPLELAPDTPAATAYNDPAHPVPEPSPLGVAIADAVAALANERDLPAPTLDGRLQAAGDELAAIAPEHGALPYPLIEFALQRHGVIEPSPRLIVIWGAIDRVDTIVEQLADRLPDILVSGRYTRVGVGRSYRGEDGDGVAIVILQASRITTRPIPRALPDGGGFELTGEFAGGLEKPEVFVTREDGKVEQLALRKRKQRGFTAAFSCGKHRGLQQVEVTAEDASGSTVLANFPVWCRAEPPTRAAVTPTEDDTSPASTPAEAEARMVELVNRDRVAHGLPALAVDARVADVARAHSLDMQARGEVAHVSPTTGEAADRVKAAAIRTGVVLENVAHSTGVLEAHNGLMNSPGHRANLLSRHATHIGVGIAFGELSAGRREMYVTQVFIRVPPKLAPGEAERLLAAEIGKLRPGGRGPLVRHAPLAQLAQEFAVAVARGEQAAAVSKRISPRLRPLSRQFTRLATVVTAVADVAMFNAKSSITSAGATHYGLGVAQGSHPEMGDNAIFIVLLVGDGK